MWLLGRRRVVRTWHVKDYRGQDRVVVDVTRARVDESGGTVGVGTVSLVDVPENVVCWFYSLLQVKVKRGPKSAGCMALSPGSSAANQNIRLEHHYHKGRRILTAVRV